MYLPAIEPANQFFRLKPALRSIRRRGPLRGSSSGLTSAQRRRPA
jgi:hypothetical protein